MRETDAAFRDVMTYVTDWAGTDVERQQEVMAALFDVLNPEVDEGDLVDALSS
jgi:hypothetical protein